MAQANPGDVPLPAERVIGEEGLCASGGKLRLAARLPWYRSLPFSTVNFEKLAIDRTTVARDSILFELEGERFTLAQMAERTDRFWFILDTAYLVFEHPAATDGGTHEVSLTTTIHPPYIPGLRRANAQTAMLEVRR